MARVTVEDCIEKLPNRYELVALAARRAKDIAAGAPLTLSRDNDKDAVVSLREIAEGTVAIENLREAVVQSFQQRQSMERLMASEKAEASSEVTEAFASEQIEAKEEDAATLEQSGMSFGDDNVDVED